MRTLRLFPVLLLALPGCFFIGDGSGGPDPGSLSVTAEVSSASLASDCAARAAAPTNGLVAGDCAPEAGTCGGFCQQSTVQLKLVASPARPNDPAAAEIELVTVRVLDATTNAVVDEIAGRIPERWTGSRFETWNEQVAAGTEVRASYKLEAPDWTKIGSGEAWRTRSMRLKIEVVLRIDGVLRTIRSGEITREPEVVT